MRLAQRQLVEGTEPHIYVGRRVNRDLATGQAVESNRWWAEYCWHGRQRWESLETGNKQAAVQKVWEIHRRLRAGVADMPDPKVTLAEVMDGYLQTIRDRGRAPLTVSAYELVQRNLTDWLSGDGQRRVSSLDEADFWSFHRYLRQLPLAEKTAYSRTMILRQALKWAHGKRLIARNPFSSIDIAEPESKAQPCFTPEQVAMLLDNAGEHYRPIFTMLAYTGLRFGEAAGLRWEDVELKKGPGGFITVRRGGSSGKTKGRRSRRIPVASELDAVLRELPRASDRVFTALPSQKYPSGGAPLNERRALIALKRLCRRCGFANPDQYKLHTFRHVFASMCASNNISYKYALEWMGHKSSDILDCYYTMFDKVAQDAINTIVYPMPTAGTTKEKAWKGKKKEEALAG